MSMTKRSEAAQATEVLTTAANTASSSDSQDSEAAIGCLPCQTKLYDAKSLQSDMPPGLHVQPSIVFQAAASSQSIPDRQQSGCAQDTYHPQLFGQGSSSCRAAGRQSNAKKSTKPGPGTSGKHGSSKAFTAPGAPVQSSFSSYFKRHLWRQSHGFPQAAAWAQKKWL
ncbi:hypothetical protein WJX77_011916 [Trebouxia sp. C0004]